MNKIIKFSILALIIISAVFISGCNSEEKQQTQKPQVTTTIEPTKTIPVTPTEKNEEKPPRPPE